MTGNSFLKLSYKLNEYPWYIVYSDDNYASDILSELAQIYHSMDKSKQLQVTKRLMLSGALPLSRDTPSYAAMMSIVEGNISFVLYLYFYLH